MLAAYTALALLALQVGALITGESSCNTYMCVTGLHDSDTNTDTYTLAPPRGSPIPQSQFGYMAIGFGTQMGGSPMIIGWPGSDGSILLSQRQASGHSMPQVVSSPPRAASLLRAQSFSNTSSTSISFTIPSNSDSTSNSTSLIWAFGTDNPGSSASASMRQHSGHGTMTLALLTPIQAAASTSASPSGSGTSTPVITPTGVVVSDSSGQSGTSGGRNGVILTHVVLGALAAMVLVPLGVLTPRLGRGWNTSRWWFPVHAVLNSLGAVLAIAAFGYASAKFDRGYNSTHPALGLTFFILMILQVLLGIGVHWIKPRHNKTSSGLGRGPTNYVHIGLGITTMAIGFAAVYTGMTIEWPRYSGSGAVGSGWIAGWAVVVAVASVAYIAGFALLPKQLRNEKAAQEVETISHTTSAGEKRA